MLQKLSEADLKAVCEGQAPANCKQVAALSVGLDSMTDFFSKVYLDDYIPSGGSKIKFVTGHPGSGKTHFARHVLGIAEEKDYLTVSISAKSIWLNDFREIYLEILRQCDIEQVLTGCARQIMARARRTCSIRFSASPHRAIWSYPMSLWARKRPSTSPTSSIAS